MDDVLEALGAADVDPMPTKKGVCKRPAGQIDKKPVASKNVLKKPMGVIGQETCECILVL